MDNKGQISMEMLIVAAAVIGLAVLLWNTLNSTATDASKTLDSKTEDLLDKIKDMKVK